MQLFKTPHIPFLKYKYFALAITLTIIVAGVLNVAGTIDIHAPDCPGELVCHCGDQWSNRLARAGKCRHQRLLNYCQCVHDVIFDTVPVGRERSVASNSRNARSD